MYGRSGLDRFKKAQSLEPFQVSANSASKNTTQPTTHESISKPYNHVITKKGAAQDAMPSVVPAPTPTTQVGGGQSTWHPPDWAIDPRPGVYYLEVMKEKEVLDRINLDRKRHIFGRQFQACDFVLDHQSVSRQHAVVIPHKNGSIYVIDLGSAHGTFVANERLTKDTPAELEVGQSLRFAASTRSYILRKNEAALFPPPLPTEINLPSPPDPSDEDGVVAYNTILNRYGLGKSNVQSKSSGKYENRQLERPAKRIKKSKVIFRDQVGGELVEVVGVSDGADVETEPGPVGVEGGSLVGKYESLVHTTVVPKGKEQWSAKPDSGSQKGVTDKLQEVLNKVKSAPKGGMYDDLYGETLSGKMGSSWAYSTRQTETKVLTSAPIRKPGINSSHADDDIDDDLFGD